MCRPPQTGVPTGHAAEGANLVAGLPGHTAAGSINLVDAQRAWAWNSMVGAGLQDGRFQATHDESKTTFTAAQLQQQGQNFSAAQLQQAASQQQQHLQQQLQMLQQKQQLQLLQQQQQQQQQLRMQQQLAQAQPAMAAASWNPMKGLVQAGSQEELQKQFQGSLIPTWNQRATPGANLEAWAKPSGAANIAPRPVPSASGPGLAWAYNPEMDAHTEDDGEEMDEKKYKRMMSNRASAKRSRQRRQVRLEELEIQSAKLKMENAAVQRRLSEANDKIRRFQDQNAKLERELKRLREELVDCNGGSNGGGAGSSLSQGSKPLSPGKESALSSPQTAVTDVEGIGEETNAPGKRRRTEEGSADADALLLSSVAAVVKAEALFLDEQGNADAGREDEDSEESESQPSPSEFSDSVADVPHVAVATNGNPPAAANGYQMMGRDMDVADGEFFATLIDCFDGKPMDAFLV